MVKNAIFTIFLVLFNFLTPIVCLGIYKPENNGQSVLKTTLKASEVPQSIDEDIFTNLFTYAHLIDISYCVSKFGRIRKPFNCDLECDTKFPNVSLVYQWYFHDSVCGYIATTYDNIFNYNDSNLNKKKTIIVSLRGTRSVFDSFTDLKVDMTNYLNLRYNLPPCINCRVHRGFYEYYTNTLHYIKSILEDEIAEDYELVFLGHSMGGSIAMLLALHYLDLGCNNTTLITMGQPLMGNINFVKWADMVLGSKNKAIHNSRARKFLRIIHKNDIVTTLPESTMADEYAQFDNQIYLNCSHSNSNPSSDQVVDCRSGDNAYCISKDFSTSLDLINKNYYEAHNTYFRKIGLCGIRVKEDTEFLK